MSINSIKYETSGDINWGSLQPCKTSTYAGSCYGGAWSERDQDAYILFRDKKDISEEDRERLFGLLDAQACYSYAMEVVKGRWEKGEAKILKNAKFCYLYALNIIKGRWEEAEDKIANHYFHSLAYAKNVIKGRFPKGEGLIFEKKFTIGGTAMESVEFFNYSDAPGDNCRDALREWNRYEGMDAQDAYTIELFGKRCERFEKKIMRSTSSRYKKKTKILATYARNCCPGGKLPESMHNYMLKEALGKDKNALEYCGNFPEDLLKAQTLDFAPAPVKKDEFTDEMKDRLARIVQRQIAKTRPNSEWEEHVRNANSFFVSLGCETRTRSYSAKKQVWEFDRRRTRGPVWLEYERGPWDKSDCYWVGIPKDLARKILAAGTLP